MKPCKNLARVGGTGVPTGFWPAAQLLAYIWHVWISTQRQTAVTQTDGTPLLFLHTFALKMAALPSPLCPSALSCGPQTGVKLWRCALLSVVLFTPSQVSDFVLHGGSNLLQSVAQLHLLGRAVLFQRCDDLMTERRHHYSHTLSFEYAGKPLININKLEFLLDQI